MADVGALADHGFGWFARPMANWARRTGLLPVGLSRISLLLAVCAAIWFTEGGLRGALAGSLLLGAVLCTDAVAAQLRGDGVRDALDAWLAAVLSRLREYTVYAGLAIGGAITGVADAWAWAAGALIALALHDAVAAARGAGTGTGPEPLRGRHGPAPHRSGPPIDTMDPGRAAADRSPSDPSLAEELFDRTDKGGTDKGGTDKNAPGRPGNDGHGDPVRIRTVPATDALPGWEEGRQRAIRAVRGQARSAKRTRGRAALFLRWPLIRGIPAFPQAGRFAIVALTITIWDARVTFIALIVGCAIAVSGELTERPGRNAAR